MAAGVPLADFDEVTAAIAHWDEWCSVWSERAAVHETLGREALAAGFHLSAGRHLTRAALCYHFGKFLFVNDMAQLRESHRKSVECRNKALPFLRPYFPEAVTDSCLSATLLGTGQRPRDDERRPVGVVDDSAGNAPQEHRTQTR